MRSSKSPPLSNVFITCLVVLYKIAIIKDLLLILDFMPILL